MKVECPVCYKEGILEVRGNSQRVLHYRGFVNGKRIYERHPLGVNGNNGNKSLGINKAINNVIIQNNQGLVVQLGKTSPSRGEDRRFKSGPAHFRFKAVRVHVPLVLLTKK
jgi:hypothetical protein